MPQKEHQEAAGRFEKLLAIIETLRNPKGGCLWDIRQTKADVGRYLLDETYEVLDAIEKGSSAATKEESGDLLFMILFLARIAEEENLFEINGVLEDITAKMIRRHPHVFGEATVKDAAEVKRNWDQIKRDVEKRGEGDPSILARVPRALPALLRAQKITAEAAKVGFDWDSAQSVIAKVEEEMGEFRAAISEANPDRVREEIGDILFSIVNLSRHLSVNAEEALRTTNRKFEERFLYIEQSLRERGKDLASSTLEEMDALWEEAKGQEIRKSGK
ncbi:MAG TPA: nucleoside triphosphate pyrophosphohydrolase [Syntrophales bacterium]|nr:nucleoside triphosphate pyrophosphohydrolase [Syntrophales bacterium]